MNLNCCILENESIYIRQLSSLLEQWETESNCQLHIDWALSGIKFLQMDSKKYDIIFIDIILDNDQNGIEIARKLRADSFKGELVFLTNFQDYVFEGYPVHALDYIMKPASYERIRHCMEHVLEKATEANFIYRENDTINKVPYSDILYFSSSNHAVNIVTVKKTGRITQGLQNVLKNLPSQFVQCHRTIIVNIDHIEQIKKNELILSNQEVLPIGRKYLETLRRTFVEMIKKRRMLS